MIVVHAILKAKKGMETHLGRALRDLVDPSRTESGNLGYEPCISLLNPERLIVVEAWKDQAALDAHFQSPHFRRLVERLDDLADGAPDIKKFEATQT